MPQPIVSPMVYTDLSGLAALRMKARTGSGDSTRQAAEQFAAVFVQMVVKSMRDASPEGGEGGLFDSDQMKFYQEMFDQQYAINVSQSRGLKLVDVIERQLRAQAPSAPADAGQAAEVIASPGTAPALPGRQGEPGNITRVTGKVLP